MLLKNYRLKLIKAIKKFIGTKIQKKIYERTGHCIGCGECCSHIYVRHAKDVIKEEAEFEKLRTRHPFYSYLDVIGKDETGLIFRCRNRDEESKRCKIHSLRPKICRDYPQEEIFLLGGGLAPNCGYKFTPYNSFEDVMNKLQKNKKCLFQDNHKN